MPINATTLTDALRIILEHGVAENWCIGCKLCEHLTLEDSKEILQKIDQFEKLAKEFHTAVETFIGTLLTDSNSFLSPRVAQVLESLVEIEHKIRPILRRA